MKIVYLAAGAGDMVCGSCLHDNTLCAAMIAAGEDAQLVPLYTPLRTDEPSVSGDRVFFGGINVYLQQHSALFRHTPRWLDRLLDSMLGRRWLLRQAGRRASSTNPAQLGPLTVSMLRGDHGRQKKELDKLCQWLEAEVQPDVVHLSNTLLSGTAGALRRRLGVPVVCSLSGEDLFIEQVPEPFHREVRDLLRENCRDIDALISMNTYYAEFMAEYLGVERARIEVIAAGLRLDGMGESLVRDINAPVRIGYLARICHEKGLHVLVDAVAALANRLDLPPFELKVAGYLGARDRAYLADVWRKVDGSGLSDRFETLGELDRPQKIEFLRSLDIFSVPTVYHESKGLSAIEALACGVPVVLPAHGCFPELVEETGGGLLWEPCDPASLAETLARLIVDGPQRQQLGRRGREVVHRHRTASRMADETTGLYRRLIGR